MSAESRFQLTTLGGQRRPNRVEDVGAQRVHAQRGQAAGVVRIIHRPDDHPAPGLVDRVDQCLIDHRAVWPVVAGARSRQGVRRVDQIGIGEDADSHPRIGAVYRVCDAVIEAVDRCRRRYVARQAGQHSRLDARRLHLDVDRRTTGGGLQHVIKGRDSLAGRPHCCSAQRSPVHLDDPTSGQDPGGPRELRIVMHHYHPIPRRMDIQFPPIRAQRRGGEEPGQGILAVPAGHAAMRDEGGQGTIGHSGRGGAGVEKSGTGNSDLNMSAQAASAYQTDMPHLIRAGDDAQVDLALIARWNSGDQRAATALVERHATSLTRFVASLGVQSAPEELVQDTFVRAFGSLDAFRGESSLRSWLFTIARRLVLDQRRAGRRDRLHVAIEDAQDQLVSANDVLDGVVADESERRVRQAVARLSPLQREVFTLRVVEGLSYKEIAVIADTTEGAARVHYHNAMRAVKEFLDA